MLLTSSTEIPAHKAGVSVSIRAVMKPGTHFYNHFITAEVHFKSHWVN
jgi:hypothetical protein